MTDTAALPPLPPLVMGGKEVDGRTLPARRYKAVCADLASDMGGDPSAGQWLLIARCAGLTVQAEQLEAQIVRGEAVDVGVYSKLVNSLARVLGQLGLQRRARDVTPSGPVLDSHTAALMGADDD